MLNRIVIQSGLAAVLIGFPGVLAADVFHLSQDATSLQFVTVGNPGNAGDTRFPDPDYGVLTCGAVGYTYDIGKYDVTAAQYTQFLNAVAATDTYELYNPRMGDPAGSQGCNIVRSGLSGSYSYSVAADWANRPVNWVSWGDAARFCNWLENRQPTGGQGPGTTEDGSYHLNGAVTTADLMAVTRTSGARYVLPTEDEWYKAAYHKNNGTTGDYWDYPTGTDNEPSNVLSATGSNHANYFNYAYSTLGYAVGTPYYRSEVGAMANSASPYGTFDQGGNVWQWNETPVSDFSRGIRGGGFSSASEDLEAESRIHYSPPTDEYPDTGFRVAIAPEPSTWLLLTAGILTAAAARRRRKKIR